jgi:hypothetical protein
MSEDVKSIIERAERADDPEVRLKAAKYKAWAKAGNDLDAARAAVETEKSRFSSRRTDLENAIAEQNNSAKAIRGQQQPIIDAAQALIDAQLDRVVAARDALDQEVAAHISTMEGLRSAVVAAEGVDARLNAEGL